MRSNQNAEVVISINHKLSGLSKTGTQRSIYRVHKELRDVNNKAYDPELIAIGPYHRDKDNLKMMEEHKLRYLQLLLERQKQNVEMYISAIGELEQKARDCYAYPVTLSRAKFVEMLVLDGCFIIELVRKNHNDDPTCANDPIFQMVWMLGDMMSDLILFENQIPFFVLCKLFDLIEGQNQHHILIHYLLHYFKDLFARRSKEIRHKSSQEIKHLLDLVHYDATNDIDLFRDQVPINLNRENSFIPSATELKDANVKFRRKEKSDTVFEVEFKNGIMEMPPLVIHDKTECVLRSLVAYEQYFLNNDQINLITDFVLFLDFLINSVKDVDILCECGIISNCLGNSEVVADTINRLVISATCPGNFFVYAKMFDRVNIHYKKGWNKSMAMLRRDIFYSPWASISFVVGLLFLVLTVAQAVCSILQVV